MCRNAKKSERSANWEHEEVAVLCTFVQENTAKLFGTNTKGKKAEAGVESMKVAYWKKASEVLVANGGRQRDWDKIRKKWVDVASKAKSYHREISKTGE